MITWLQNFFLKHNKWLFGGLLIVIIVTFVLTIGPQSFFGSGSTQQRQSLQFYGYDLTNESDQRALAFTAEISAILHPELQVRREQLMDYAYLRATALGIANQLGIPQPTKDDLADFVETLETFQNPQTGEFSPEAYTGMMNALQSSDRYDREAIATVLREDYRIQQVRNALAGPDYSLPFELEREYIDRLTQVDLALARFDYASFDPEIEAGDEALLQFFNENPARYEIPETISVAALMFKGEAYLDEVAEPTEAELETYFTTNKTRYQPQAETPEDGTEAEVPEVTLADVRDEVVSDWKAVQARRIAAKKSEQFSLRLWQEAVALDSPEYNALIEQFSVETQPIPPYARNQPPRIQAIPAELLSSMWIYVDNPNRYFSDIGQIADGAVVLVNRGVTPARMPEFEEVKASVEANYRMTEKRRLFSEKGEELKATIEERLTGESFADIASSLGLEVDDLDSFSGENVPRELLQNTVWDQAQFLDQGELSRMILQGQEGIFAYMQDKVVPEIDKESEAYQEYLAERTSFVSDGMGWSRLREISDQSLSALLGPTETE
jgi:peptidyl-prolyl cis-trans isomerase D